jgi:hypothetical protein
MPYYRPSPSTNNSIGSNRHWAAFQRDGLYTVAEGEGRAHLKYIRNFLVYWSVTFLRDDNNFLFLLGFGHLIYNYFVLFMLPLPFTLYVFYIYWQKEIFCMWITLLIYCFLWEGNFILLHKFELGSTYDWSVFWVKILLKSLNM